MVCSQVSVPVQSGRVLLDNAPALPYVPWFATFQTWCQRTMEEEASLEESDRLIPNNVAASFVEILGPSLLQRTCDVT